jgi:hypothetical protein
VDDHGDSFSAPLEVIREAIAGAHCPSCGAEPGDPCRYRDGKLLYGGIHWWRLKMWMNEWPP